MYQSKEDREALEVIACLDERLSLEEIDVGGKRKKIIRKGYYGYLFGIERFVKDIEARWKGAFVEQTTRYSKIKKIRELYLGKTYYRFVNIWLERYSDLYRYSARVEVFYDACKKLRLLSPDPFYLAEPGDICGADGMRYMDLFNALIDEVHERCQSREFKERERLRLENADRNATKVLTFGDAMFEAKSRWLVLDLTLSYQAKFRRWITVEQVQRHRKRFFVARRFNELMSGIRSYVWGMEQDEKGGLHLHVILFYSSESNHDEFIAQQICEYWDSVVTEGKGEAWNSNRAWLKRRYRMHGHGVGIGQIDRTDTEKREALRKNLLYLAKAEQYLLSRSTERIRTFDMGRVPRKVKAGRPRNQGMLAT